MTRARYEIDRWSGTKHGMERNMQWLDKNMQ